MYHLINGGNKNIKMGCFFVIHHINKIKERNISSILKDTILTRSIGQLLVSICDEIPN